MGNRRKFIQQLTATAGAFSAGSIFNQLFAAKFEMAEKYVSGLSPAAAASEEDYWSVIQQAFTVNPNIINLNNGGGGVYWTRAVNLYAINWLHWQVAARKKLPSTAMQQKH